MRLPGIVDGPHIAERKWQRHVCYNLYYTPMDILSNAKVK